MQKKYIVRLSKGEREELLDVVRRVALSVRETIGTDVGWH